MHNPFLDDEENESPSSAAPLRVQNGSEAAIADARTHHREDAFAGTTTTNGDSNNRSGIGVAGQATIRLALGKSLKLGLGNGTSEKALSSSFHTSTATRTPSGSSSSGGQNDRTSGTTGKLTLKLGRGSGASGGASTNTTAPAARPLVLTVHGGGAGPHVHPTEVTGWWAFFCNCDTTGRFRSDAAFQRALVPLSTAPADTFYAAMNDAFERHRRQDWAPVVLGEAPVFRQRPDASASPPITRESIFEEGRRAVLEAGARWTESLRVQRLVAQHLLLSMSDGTREDEPFDVSDDDSGRTGLGGHQQRWRFEVACPKAVYAAVTGVLPAETREAAAPLDLPVKFYRRPQEDNITGLETLLVGPVSGADSARYDTPQPLPDVSSKGMVRDDGVSTHGAPVAVAAVPTRMRILLLLRVLDTLWAEPHAQSFRLPVTEWEAKGYRKSIRDPVCLLGLYEDVFRGCPLAAHTTPSARSSHKNEPTDLSHLTTRVQQPWQRNILIDYAALKERLVLMRANSLSYNGDGSVLGKQAAELVSLGVKAIRDAQAEEEGEGKYLSLIQEQQRTHGVAMDVFQGTLVDDRGRTHFLTPFTVAELKEIFPVTAWPTAKAETEEEAPKPKKLSLVMHKTTPAAEALEEPEKDAAPAPRRRGRPPNATRSVDTGAGKEAHDAAQKENTAPPRRARNPKKDSSDAEQEGPPHKRRRKPREEKESKKEAEQIFWICCDRCGEWRQLPRKLDPPPSYWECGYMGQTCDAQGTTQHAAEAERKRRAVKAGTATTTSRVKARRAPRKGQEKSFAELYADLARPTESDEDSSSSDSSSSSESSSSSSSDSDDSSPSGRSSTYGRSRKKTKEKKRPRKERAKHHGSNAAKRAVRAPLTLNELAQLEEQMAAMEAQPVSEDPIAMLKAIAAMEWRL